MELKKPTHLFIAELLNKNQKIIKMNTISEQANNKPIYIIDNDLT